jgi:hypothetical protein
VHRALIALRSQRTAQIEDQPRPRTSVRS